jgi:hypothetical protein
MTITKEDILKDEDPYDICELVEEIFSTLYIGNENISEAEFAQNLSAPLQLTYFLTDAADYDLLDEYLTRIYEEIENPKEKEIFQEKFIWALEEIGKSELAILAKKIRDDYKKSGKLDEDLTRQLTIEFGDYESVKGLYQDVSQYIKNNIDQVITEEYKLKELELEKSEPAHKFKSEEEYKKEVANGFPWLKF